MFVFRPARILRLRQLALLAQQRELAMLLAREGELRAREEALLAAAASALHAARESLATPQVDITHILHHRHHLGRIRAEHAIVRQELAGQRQRVAEQRVVVAERLKAVRVLEKLRERQMAEHDALIRASDNREMDERGIVRAAWEKSRRAAAGGHE